MNDQERTNQELTDEARATKVANELWPVEVSWPFTKKEDFEEFKVRVIAAFKHAGLKF